MPKRLNSISPKKIPHIINPVNKRQNTVKSLQRREEIGSKVSTTLSLQRFFIDSDNVESIRGKKITRIYVDTDNNLIETEYSNIYIFHPDAQELKNDNLLGIEDIVVMYDVVGYVANFGEGNILCNDIDLRHFLFIDKTEDKFYYIDYTMKPEKLFDLYEKKFKRNLQLKIYNGKILINKDDVENFMKDETKTEYLKKTYGGRTSNKIKIIKRIKKY